jgi:hypothetical protein
MEYFRQRFIDELNDEGPVAIRTFEWPSVDVFKAIAPELYEAHFVDWLGAAKDAAKDRARESLTENGCLDRFNVSIRRGTRSRGLDSFLLGLPVPWEQFRQA